MHVLPQDTALPKVCPWHNMTKVPDLGTGTNNTRLIHIGAGMDVIRLVHTYSTTDIFPVFDDPHPSPCLGGEGVKDVSLPIGGLLLLVWIVRIYSNWPRPAPPVA